MTGMFSPNSLEFCDPEPGRYCNIGRGTGRADAGQSAGAAGLAGDAGAVRHAAEAGGSPEPRLAGRCAAHSGMCWLSKHPSCQILPVGGTWVVNV